MAKIFDLVYQLLKWLSKISGFTYREINIIVYFILIPSFFIFLISRILNQKYIIISFLLFILVSVLLIPDFTLFSSLLFDKSVSFLNWFEFIGLNYIQTSVIICVIIPIIVIISLFYFKKHLSNSYKTKTI